MQEYADFLFTQSAHSPPFCPARTTGGTRPLHGISIVYKLGAGTERVWSGYGVILYAKRGEKPPAVTSVLFLKKGFYQAGNCILSQVFPPDPQVGREGSGLLRQNGLVEIGMDHPVGKHVLHISAHQAV